MLMISKDDTETIRNILKGKNQPPGLVLCSVNGLAVKYTHTKKAELVCLLRNQVTTANPFAVLPRFTL